jgi:hypothetical protein
MFGGAGRSLVAGDAASARKAYETLLGPLSRADISLPGVDEFPDEVLSSCMTCRSSQYLPLSSVPTVEAAASVTAATSRPMGIRFGAA